jgi:hypothetical protein
MTILSKSKYLAFLQCAKLLWYNYNAKDKIPPPDAATQAIFDQGHEVGLIARELYPGGIEVGSGIIDMAEVDRLSREALMQRKPLYEAGFIHQQAYARADILVPAERTRWDLFEVKSSTEVKDINLQDLAFQWHTYAGAGVDIRKVFIVYINKMYVRKGEVDPQKLFIQADITADVEPLLKDVKKGIPAALEIISHKTEPDIPIGPQCSDPYECPLKEFCWKFLPRQNVMTLYRIGARGFDLLNEGVLRIMDLPAGVRLTASQAIQAKAVRTRTPQVNRSAIESFLQKLEYPCYYLDFETFGTAIPLFDDSRPYQQIPFQYSLQIQQKPGSKTQQKSFLSDGKSDPRPEVLSRLKDELGDTGSIIAYNASFERNRFAQAVQVLPSFRKWWEKTEPRLVDLLVPFRQFSYYHPDQEGSASIKAVLPALTGKGYEGMEIADGGTASLEFLRVMMTLVSAPERERVRERLVEYCGRDTGGMVEIVEKLNSLRQ